MANPHEDPIMDHGAKTAPVSDDFASVDPSGKLPATPGSDSTMVKRREKRIVDFLDESLNNPMTEVGVVGGVTADLARLELRANQALMEVLAECQNPGEILEAISEATDILLKVTRQIERCSRLTRDLSQSPPTAVQATPFGKGPIPAGKSEATAI